MVTKQFFTWIEKQGPPRQGLVPKSGDWEHPDHWVLPPQEKTVEVAQASVREKETLAARLVQERWNTWRATLDAELAEEKALGTIGEAEARAKVLEAKEKHSKTAALSDAALEEVKKAKRAAKKLVRVAGVGWEAGGKAVEFTDDKDLDEKVSWLNRRGKKWASLLTKAERYAIRMYKSDDEGMENPLLINEKLRGGEKLDKNLRTYVQLIDSALKKGGFEKDLVVFRGIRHISDISDIKNKILVDKGFLSTAFTEETASEFAYSSKQAKIILKITIKKGTPAVYVDVVIPSGEEYDEPEEEILLPRNLPMTVSDVVYPWKSYGGTEYQIVEATVGG